LSELSFDRGGIEGGMRVSGREGCEPELRLPGRPCASPPTLEQA